MIIYGNTSEGNHNIIIGDLLTDANADPRNHFEIRKHSISRNTGLENGMLNCKPMLPNVC